MQSRRAWDWNNPRFLSQQPCQRNLSRRRLLSFCDVAKKITQRPIGFASLGRETRKCITEIGAIERGCFVHFSRQKSSAQRAVWNKADSKFFEHRQDFFLRFSPPK